MQGQEQEIVKGRRRRRAAGITALLIGALAPIAGARAQEDEAREDALVRWYDVRALTHTELEDPEGVDLRLHLSSILLDELEPQPDSYDVPLENDDDPADQGWSGLLWDCMGEEWVDDAFQVEEHGGFLRVEGHAATQSEVDSILSDLEAYFLESVELELFILAPDAVPADTGALLNPAEVESLIAATPVLGHARTTARLGQRARFGISGFEAALIDYDVEVASTARACDPQISVLREGTEVGAIVRALPDGGVYLRVWGRRGMKQGEPRQVPLASFDSASIELPSMSTTLVTASALLGDGGGLLFGQDWNHDGYWLLRVHRKGRADHDSSGRFVPLGVLSAMPLLEPAPMPRATTPSGGWEAFDDEDALARQLDDELREVFFSGEDVYEELRNEQEAGELDGALYPFQNSIYVRGSDALLKRARAFVEEWSARLSPGTVEVDLRFGILPHERARELTEGGEEKLSALLEALDHRVVGACRMGDALMITGGSESLYLQDHDVEIAERTAVLDPIPRAYFEGIVFWCLPTRTREGALSTWIDLLVQTNAREIRSQPVAIWEPPPEPSRKDDTHARPGNFALTGQVELPATARAGLRTLLHCPDGDWTLVCSTPLGGAQGSLVALVRTRLIPR